MDPGSCGTLLTGRENYNLFLVFRDLEDYRSKLLSSLSQNPQVSNLDLAQAEFWLNDYRAFYVQEGFVTLSKKLDREINDILSSTGSLRTLFVLFYLCVMILCVFLYRKVLFQEKRKLNQRLLDCYVVLPMKLIIHNSYIVNFFKLKKSFSYS